MLGSKGFVYVGTPINPYAQTAADEPKKETVRYAFKTNDLGIMWWASFQNPYSSLVTRREDAQKFNSIREALGALERYMYERGEKRYGDITSGQGLTLVRLTTREVSTVETVEETL